MGDEFDRRLLQIRLPDVIARAPRSIGQKQFWKGYYLAFDTIYCY